MRLAYLLPGRITRWDAVVAALVIMWAAPVAFAEGPAGLPDETPSMAPSPGDSPVDALWNEDLSVLAPDGAGDNAFLKDDLRKAIDRELSLNMDYSSLYGQADPAAPAAGAEKAPPPEAKAAPAKRGPPLPLYTVEGVGGGLIVPHASLVNPGPPGTIVSLPTTGYTFVKLGSKTVMQASVTETFWRRIEVGYALSTLDLGNFTAAVQRQAGVDLGFTHVVMHNFNIRGLLIEEGKYNPALTAGVTFKYNPTIQHIDEKLHGGARALGMARSNGTDFTLTATKMVIDPWLKRPLIGTAGLRFSQGAQLGLLGFGDAYRLTCEGSVCYMVTDWMVVAYEFRQKKNPYQTLGHLVGPEDNWHTVCLAFLLSDRLAFACGWGHFGNVVNKVENGVWGFQVKYEF